MPLNKSPEVSELAEAVRKLETETVEEAVVWPVLAMPKVSVLEPGLMANEPNMDKVEVGLVRPMPTESVAVVSLTIVPSSVQPVAPVAVPVQALLAEVQAVEPLTVRFSRLALPVTVRPPDRVKSLLVGRLAGAVTVTM